MFSYFWQNVQILTAFAESYTQTVQQLPKKKSQRIAKKCRFTIYPAAHKKLAAEVAKKGLILSEYPPLTAPTRYSFPMRNRIISGLSQGTLVVEANDRSGALITAKDAILQGRSVYALPGNVDNPTSNS